jgi:hypothetical protein
VLQASSKLTQQISTQVTKLVDTIAPLSEEDLAGGPGVLAFGKLVLWVCMPITRGESATQLHDFVQAQVNQMWLGNRGICSRIVVNTVEHPSVHVSTSLAHAMSSVEVCVCAWLCFRQ